MFANAFSTPWLVVLDSLRILLFIGGLYWLFLLAMATMKYLPASHRWRLVAVALLLASSDAVRIDRLGDPGVSYHIIVCAVAVVIGIITTHEFVYFGDRGTPKAIDIRFGRPRK